MAATKTTRRTMPDMYFKLVKQLPLAPLRDETDLVQAQAMLDKLLSKELDEGGEAYLEVLTSLVEDYEMEHHPIPDASEADVLRYLLEANHLKQADLARKVGMAPSTISSVLKGNRSLTKSQVVALASFFQVHPALFLPSYTARGLC